MSCPRGAHCSDLSFRRVGRLGMLVRICREAGSCVWGVPFRGGLRGECGQVVAPRIDVPRLG
eukprot:1586203-Prorocentrum_lima.AAC.1